MIPPIQLNYVIMKSIVRRSRIITLLLSSSLVLTIPTLAKDFLREVCIGFVTLDSPVPLKTLEKLVLVYDDHRSGADKRKITVSISQAGGNRIYQGTNISDGIVTPLKIANVDDPNDILFDGTVEYISGGIELVGKYFPAGNPKGMTIKTTLVGDEIP
jgi:hypothetical protein